MFLFFVSYHLMLSAAWDFLGVNFWSRDFLGFDFCPIRLSPQLEIRTTPPHWGFVTFIYLNQQIRFTWATRVLLEFIRNNSSVPCCLSQFTMSSWLYDSLEPTIADTFCLFTPSCYDYRLVFTRT